MAKKPSNRAGRYVTQQTGYKAFIPAPLPPEPRIEIAGELRLLLSQADRFLGRLDGSILTLPNPDLFVYMYVRKEAVLSSQIEGTQSSLHDVLSAEAKIFSPDQPGDINDVVNYVAAMNHGLTKLAELPISVRLIKEIHAKLLQGVRGANLNPGEIRKSQNWIGPQGATLKDAVFVPPPHTEVAQHLGNLERFIHSENEMPLLLKIGLAHAQFQTIHPFLDGNGRVGRLLITFLLCEREVLLKPVLYLSHYFKKYREQYYQELQSVRDKGTWESWLSFFLQGVISVAQEATETARQIIVLREAHRLEIAASFGGAAGKGYQILEKLYQRPIITVENVAGWTGTTYQAANNLIKRFVEAEILDETTGQARNRKFIYSPYIALFGEI